MALKLVVEDAIDIPKHLVAEYRRGADGKFHLALEGQHPDSARLAEFRERNIALLKEVDELRPLRDKPTEARVAEVEAERTALAERLAAFEGIDPAEYRALRERPDSTKLEADLAAERAAHAATQFAHTVTTEFLRTGGRESAIDYMVANAAKVFAMQDGKLTTGEFSATKPGEPLTLSEWMGAQAVASHFAFLPSRGGGTTPRASGPRLGAPAKPNELRNPTPQQLGQHSADIAAGRIVVVHTEGGQ